MYDLYVWISNNLVLVAHFGTEAAASAYADAEFPNADAEVRPVTFRD